MDQIGDEKVLESFKLEVIIIFIFSSLFVLIHNFLLLIQVATFRKTRHENLVLFMGACMNLPTLALVTSMCKGLTLYTHLHLRKDKFSMNKTVIIAQQISQVSRLSVNFHAGCCSVITAIPRIIYSYFWDYHNYDCRVWAIFMHEESSTRT